MAVIIYYLSFVMYVNRIAIIVAINPETMPYVWRPSDSETRHNCESSAVNRRPDRQTADGWILSSFPALTLKGGKPVPIQNQITQWINELQRSYRHQLCLSVMLLNFLLSNLYCWSYKTNTEGYKSNPTELLPNRTLFNYLLTLAQHIDVVIILFSFKNTDL